MLVRQSPTQGQGSSTAPAENALEVVVSLEPIRPRQGQDDPAEPNGGCVPVSIEPLSGELSTGASKLIVAPRASARGVGLDRLLATGYPTGPLKPGQDGIDAAQRQAGAPGDVEPIVPAERLGE